jgi:hypothetical protein
VPERTQQVFQEIRALLEDANREKSFGCSRPVLVLKGKLDCAWKVVAPPLYKNCLRRSVS